MMLTFKVGDIYYIHRTTTPHIETPSRAKCDMRFAVYDVRCAKFDVSSDMFNVKDITKALRQLADEKGINFERVVEAMESALAAAYKREYEERGAIVKAKMDLKSGDVKFWRIKQVVDESMVRIVEEEEVAQDSERSAQTPNAEQKAVAEDEEPKLPRYNPERHIFLKEAREIKEDAQLEEDLIFPLESKEDFGRIAAQIAKQTVLQRIREAERDSILEEWKERADSIVSGVVQRIERGHVYIDFGRAVGVMFANESIPGEHYRVGERLRFLVIAVQEDSRMPGIILSRSHPRFVAKLFEMEVPEITEGIVEIKRVAREPGSRTKIAVDSNDESVDPIGACVGQRGTRVMAVNNELGNEKIDIVEWSEEPERFISNSLSPAHVEGVEALERQEARVYVPEDQLSLAIGRGGQNVRMAANLTGWRLDVRSQTRPEEEQEEGVAEASESVDVENAPLEDSEESKEEVIGELNADKAGDEGDISDEEMEKKEIIEDKKEEAMGEEEKVEKVKKKNEKEKKEDEKKEKEEEETMENISDEGEASTSKLK